MLKSYFTKRAESSQQDLILNKLGKRGKVAENFNILNYHKYMNKKIEEMIQKLNTTESPALDDILELTFQFQDDTEGKSDEIVKEIRQVLSRVASLDILKSFDEHYVTAEAVSFLLASDSVTAYKTSGLYTVAEDGMSTIFAIQIISAMLVDNTEITIASITENEEERDVQYEY